MPDHSPLIIAALFLAVGTLYSSVGHAGSSGYLALMALLGVQASVMRPAALVLNALVAAIAFAQFCRAGHFHWRLVWPFSCTSIPLAYAGGRVGLTPPMLNVAVGAVLILTALPVALSAPRPQNASTSVRRPPIPISMAAGAAIGVLSGMTGTGGGVFLGPLIIVFGWADPRAAAAASALFSLGNSIAGIAGVSFGAWDPPAALPTWAAAAAIGGAVGSSYGSRAATPRTLRVLLSIVLVIAGVRLAMK